MTKSHKISGVSTQFHQSYESHLAPHKHGKVNQSTKLESATFWISKQQLSNLIMTGDLQLQMMCNKTLWKAYEIVYDSFIIT
jgi:hypothetical protein